MKRVEKKRGTNRKVSFHKVFNIVSFVFLFTCVVIYGTRFVMLYMENNKSEKTKQIADTIKDNNESNKNFKNIKGDYYFYGTDVNNYVKYSNMLWRIIRVDKKGNVVISLDSNASVLARGTDSFQNSSLSSWLNKGKDDVSGIFQDSLNDVPQYLSYTESCLDDVTDIEKISCDKKTSKTYVTVPSLNDYVNTGSSKSFLNNGGYYYLINNDGKDKVWCVDNEGKIASSSGDDVIGIKPVVTIKNLAMVKSGDGSKASPYEFEDGVSTLVGSYVKLGNDIWQVYFEDEEKVKLVLDNYLTVNGTEVQNRYSRSGYQFNASEYGSLANYLNNKYFNTLAYNKVLEDFSISNGIYTNHDYREVLKSQVNTKVGILSVGDMILNQENSDYFLSTGCPEGTNMMYVYQTGSKLHTRSATNMLNVIPTISIKKSLILEHGTKEKPYEVVYE